MWHTNKEVENHLGKNYSLTKEECEQVMEKGTARYQEMNGKLRLGQCIFNAMYTINPDLGKLISGTDYSCFSDDSKIIRFITLIKKR
jgi:hypothetical protein